ncbi:hypothetical protein NLU13_5283 [Sarocladium strictum]|uniref:ABC transporter n=1 Tax=Sarocladium strictum TaxID=5046 RepID=A0AA39GGL3_SARSR|nr:hypothetical protein NLU13_5283 [Sarocladium strictum]
MDTGSKASPQSVLYQDWRQGPGTKAHLSDSPRLEALMQALLSFGPSAWLLAGCFFRFLRFRTAESVSQPPNNGGLLKAAVAVFLCATEIASHRSHGQCEPANQVTALFLPLASLAAVLVLTLLKNSRDVGPSSLLAGYLVFSIFADAIQAGLLHVNEPSRTTQSFLSAGLVARLVLLTLETRSSKDSIGHATKNASPEDTSGFLSVLFFWWVNGFLRLGHSKALSPEDMPPLPKALDPARNREALEVEWQKRGTRTGRFTLVWAQLRCLRRLNVILVMPYALLVMLRCSQPFLVKRAIAFFTREWSGFEARNEAFRLFLMTFMLYGGIAICNGVSKRLLGQISCNTRMSLVGILYSHCLRSENDPATSSAVVSLASNDTETAANLGNVVHDTWSQVLELAVGTYLLADELGWVCVVPPLVAVFISQTVKAVTEDLGSWHVAYSQATQSRIAATKATLDAMKNVKMMGIVEDMESRIRSARAHEMKQYTLLYRLLTAFFVSGVGLHLFSPAITLVVYSIQAQLRGAASLDVSRAFTSIAIINVVTSPANTLLTILPEAMSVASSFERIQEYLLKPIWEDKRLFIGDEEADGDSGAQQSEKSINGLSTIAVRIDNVTIRPTGAPHPILRNIDTVWKKGDFIVVAGAVGTGKTTLAKALLGDLSPDVGAVHTSFKSAAYCSQTAWLPNTTIEKAIRGPSSTVEVSEDKWYQRVLRACDLIVDIQRMSQGDQTVLGSRGASLSGGQKQRVALARALYARRDFVILDDVFSALDSLTENHIISHVLGSRGLFKELGTTVVAITHSAKYLPLANHVVILDETGRIAEQGHWEQLATSNIRSMYFKDNREHVGLDARSIGEPNTTEPGTQHDPMARGRVDPYAYYIKAIGLSNFLLLIGSLFVYAAAAAAVPYCLQWMAERESGQIWLPTGAYLLLTTAAFGSVSTAVAVVFLIIAPQAGNVIHTQLLRTVMYAPLGYFTGTATGTTLNYFSSDISIIDRSLPFSLFQTCQAVFRLLAQAVLLGTLQPVITITMPLTISVVYLAQRFYLATSRQLQSLSLQAQGSVQESFLESLEGVATIRAFGWQDHFLQSTAGRLDMAWRPEYMLVSTKCWLDLVLDLLVMGLAVSVIGLGVMMKGTATGSQIGIGLNVVLQLNNYILRLIEAWAKLETAAAAVSRLRAFEREVPSEETTSLEEVPPATWPAEGNIELSHVSASYGPSVLALDDITFSIPAGTKVGIVGRTGSGKSSLLLTLLRLLDVKSPSAVRIDNVDLTDVPRNTTRSRIITVPQDPMLFSEDSLRQNLDLSSSGVSDDELVNALRRVGLWDLLEARAIDVVTSHEETSSDSEDDNEEKTHIPGGAEVGGGGDQPISKEQIFNVRMKSLPLSQGQQQLFSLARALLMRGSRGRVVLLDEATSNVDLATEKLMRQVIQDDFEAYTVITIAHRLDTIMGSDIVLVLDSGRLVEAGRPWELEKKEGGTMPSYGIAEHASDGPVRTAAAAPPPLNFLELPVDVLNLILSPLLTYSDPIPIFPDFRPLSHPVPSAVTILLIHPALLPIANHILYGNEFLIDLTTSSTSLNRGLLQDLSSSEDPRATLRKVRRLTVHLDKLRGFVTDIVGPLLQDMTQAGELRDLSIFISGRATLHREPLLNLPLQALLRCLADPDIACARLCVLRASQRNGWSEFHRVDSMASPSKAQQPWAELDWRAMIRIIDPDGKEVPAGTSIA